MEDFAIDIMIGRLFGALNPPGSAEVYAGRRNNACRSLTAPLRDRFGVIHHLEFYTEEELANIILHSSKY